MATSKRERQKAARRVKIEQMQRQAKRRQNIRRGIIFGIVAVLILGAGTLLFSSKSTTTTTTTGASVTTTTAATTTTTLPRRGSPLQPRPTPRRGRARSARRRRRRADRRPTEQRLLAQQPDHRHRARRASGRRPFGAVRAAPYSRERPPDLVDSLAMAIPERRTRRQQFFIHRRVGRMA